MFRPCRRPSLRSTSLIALLGTLAAAAVHAQGVFDYPADPDFVVVEYSRISTMLADADPTPLLTIYGDARVVVHVPVYMRRAGDYELWLTQGELRSLLARFEGHGVLAFDSARGRAERDRAEAARRAEEGRLTSISDSTRLEIAVNLARYSPAGGGPEVRDLRHKVVWNDVQVEARRYPGVAALQGLAAAERELLELSRRDDLVRLPKTSSPAEGGQ